MSSSSISRGPRFRVDDVVDPGVGQVPDERQDGPLQLGRRVVGVNELLRAAVGRLHAELPGGCHLVDQVGHLPGGHDQGVLTGGLYRRQELLEEQVLEHHAAGGNQVGGAHPCDVGQAAHPAPSGSDGWLGHHRAAAEGRPQIALVDAVARAQQPAHRYGNAGGGQVQQVRLVQVALRDRQGVDHRGARRLGSQPGGELPQVSGVVPRGVQQNRVRPGPAGAAPVDQPCLHSANGGRLQQHRRVGDTADRPRRCGQS